MRIGYLGPEGTFTHKAAVLYCKHVAGSECELIEYDTIMDLIYSVDDREIGKAIVPIENSLEGSVNVTIDMLANEVECCISGEFILNIRHSLLASHQVPLKQIKTILSHPQALAQCRQFIIRELNKPTAEQTFSTAKAASMVAERGKYCAAIASEAVASRYGLKVLAKDIQDNDNNSTRFVVIDKNNNPKSIYYKTSIVFSVDDRPGSLYEVLRIFADAGINLTKIESRPMKKMLGQYMFFIDFQGCSVDENIDGILDYIDSKCKFYKFLGSYPVYFI
ncbi:MAG: prephenate dehydratase [Clostridia bacterium]|nr:prephenate dehydratase [Clostridia bacterium]